MDCEDCFFGDGCKGGVLAMLSAWLTETFKLGHRRVFVELNEIFFAGFEALRPVCKQYVLCSIILYCGDVPAVPCKMKLPGQAQALSCNS
eukprot:5723880-Amphidinium_carterae.1